MTRRQAKAYVCACAAALLDFPHENLFLEGPDGATHADRARIHEAHAALLRELERRARGKPV